MSLDAGRVGVRADQVDIHGRVTSPSFLNDLLESLPEWTDMPVWVNGTEELLPSNNSVPVTSPILADIAYPDIRRDNQYFTYRESPTPVDGLAKIKSIKGNTLKWNQLSSIVGEQTNTVGLFDANTCIYSGHKYLMTVEATPSGSNTMYISIYYNDGSNRQYNQVTGTSSGRYTMFFNCNYTAVGGAANVRDHFWFYAYNVSLWKNLMLFDLTAMGLNSLTDAEILQWFADYYPLPYYDFNAGTLLSFNGTGLKTVGKNLLDPSSKTTYDGENGLRWYQTQGLKLKANKTYTFSASNTGEASVTVYIIDHATRTALASGSLVTTYTPTQNVIVYLQAYRGAGIPSETEFQLEIGSQTEYEPYTSHTTNLPVSTYFPTGMKSAGSVYDELTPTKATTRMRGVDLGTLTFNQSSNFYYRQNSQDLGIKADGDVAFTAVDSNIRSVYYYSDSRQFRVYVNDISIAPSGMLYYELATPVELPTLSLGE